MKGDISLPFVALIVTFAIALGILIPTKFMSVPTTRTVKYEQDHDNAQMALLSFLHSTKDGKSIQQLIGEHLVLGEPNEDEITLIIQDKLDKLVESKCYKLMVRDLKIESPRCSPKDYEKETEIPLPYNSNKLLEKITLVVN